METFIKIGSGMAKGPDSFAAGKEAVLQALGEIGRHELSAGIIFASPRYDLSTLLSGITSVTGSLPLIGTTTAGEICGITESGSVVVTLIASPFFSIRTGLGRNVSTDWRQAIDEALDDPSLRPFFSTSDGSDWNNLTKDGKSVFAILFSPGNTRFADSRSYEILEYAKQRSMGRVPIVGGSSADDWHMETNAVIREDGLYPDSVLVAVCETSLTFGAAIAHGFRPTEKTVTVTASEGHEIISLEGLPAIDIYSRLFGLSREDLENRHLSLTTGSPLGIGTALDQYTICVASFSTPRGGIRLTHPVAEGTVLTIMESSQEELLRAARTATRNAILRAGLNSQGVAGALVFSCALRSKVLGSLINKEMAYTKDLVPGTPVTGFYSFGEQGLSDDGVSRHQNEAVSVLVLGRELSYPAQVAIENRQLREELELRIGESEKARKIVEESEEQYRTAIEHSNDGVAIAGNFVYLYINRRLAEMCGYETADDIIGKPVDFLAHRNDRKFLRKIHGERMAGKAVPSHYEIRLRRKNGTSFYVEASAARSTFRGQIVSLVYLRDITGRKETEETIRQLAYHDVLTGLPNRALLISLAENAIAYALRSRHGLALLMLDLDRFKEVNDTLGHSMGDKLLQQVASRLRSIVRKSDIIARMGGDEFVLIGPGSETKESIFSMTDKVLESFRRPFLIEGHRIAMTPSIGIARYPADGSDFETLLKCADSAMYRAKILGRNRVVLYAPEVVTTDFIDRHP